VESALLDIVQLIQEHHEDKLTNILGSVRVQHSPEMKAKEHVFPIMKIIRNPIGGTVSPQGLIKKALPHGEESQQVYDTLR
jgi:hypothetical protein